MNPYEPPEPVDHRVPDEPPGCLRELSLFLVALVVAGSLVAVHALMVVDILRTLANWRQLPWQ